MAIFLEESLEKVTFCHFEETAKLIQVDTSWRYVNQNPFSVEGTLKSYKIDFFVFFWQYKVLQLGEIQPSSRFTPAKFCWI